MGYEESILDISDFNPRPPWGGRLERACAKTQRVRHFNPRPPWGGRPVLFIVARTLGRISIHALRGEGDLTPLTGVSESLISIHALRGEGDFCIFLIGRKLSGFQSTPSVGRATSKPNKEETNSQFQSTPSVGRATDNPSITFPVSNISIHALRGEGD